MAITMKAARVNSGLSQHVAAEKLGISRNTLASYENYKTIPDAFMADKMAKLYCLSVNDIIFYRKNVL